MDYSTQFASSQEHTYLLSHSVGKPPKTAQQAVQQAYFEPWGSEGEGIWPHWIESLTEFRSQLASLLNGKPIEFCPQVNLSSALTKLLSGLPRIKGKDTIVYCEHDFPSMVYVLTMAKKLGYTLKAISKEQDCLDLQVWDEAIDEQCCAVLITHVLSNQGLKLDVPAICHLAEQQQAYSIVDVAQSVGVQNIDLQAWQASFVLGSCVKWLCGGAGAGFLWANDKLIEQCQPVDVGWFSHENPFEFDIYNFRYAPDATRFLGGTPSVLPFAVAANSIALINSIGVDTIQAHNQRLTAQICDAVDPHYLVNNVPASQRGGTLVLNFAEHQEHIEACLNKHAIQFDSRPTGMRLSPHIYNTPAQIEQVIECLKP